MKIINKKHLAFTSNQISLMFVFTHFCCNVGLPNMGVPSTFSS